MFYEDRLSSQPVLGLIRPPEDQIIGDMVDYELGGVDLNDPSLGLMVKTWWCWYEDMQVKVKPEVGGVETSLFSVDRISALSLAFDQNMRPNVAYERDGELWLWWWDTSVEGRALTNFGKGKCPRLTLDDKRTSQFANSDIIFAYIDGDYNLCYRQQRERYTVERVLKTGLHRRTILKNVSMNNKLRLQFELV